MASSAQPRYSGRIVPREPGGSRISRVRWDRLGRIVLVIVLFAVLASYIGPTLHVFESWREAKAGEERLATLKDENAQLTRKARQLNDPAAAMTEARKLGLVAPGEQPYVVDGLR